MAENLGISIQMAITGVTRFQKSTSGLIGYHQNVQNLISGLVSWNIFFMKSRLHVKHADLGVIGPLGPLRSVTVK